MNHQDHLHRFGFGTATGDASMKNELGGKGANLAEMAKLGLPIPPGCTITTDQCTSYRELGAEQREVFCADWAKAVMADYAARIVPEFGYMPLVSVRSGARVSMPGMMDTILNVGLTTKNLSEWEKRLGKRAARDSYRRLIQMYACTVDGFPAEMFEEILDDVKAATKTHDDAGLTPTSLNIVIDKYKALYFEALDREFPDTLEEQLAGCIGAVFGSWMSERAVEYRAAHGIPAEWGTAVNVQAMVFGNMDDKSATGVLFTRDPNTGAPGLFGEFLINAQGEDVVAGIRTPEPLSKMKDWNPKVYLQLAGWAEGMEAHFRDMQDMEFTVQSGVLWVLQTRNGKRSAAAAFRIAHDMAVENTLSWEQALQRVTAKQYLALKRPTIDPKFAVPPTVTGIPAAGSLVTGAAVFSAEEAKAHKGPCILVATETTPDDFGGMMASVGILTVTGGATSHAAVVARGMDKTCVVGAQQLVIGQTVKPGDTVTLDGKTGRAWVNVEVPILTGQLTPEAHHLMKLARDSANGATMLRIAITSASDFNELPASGKVVLDVSGLDLTKKRERGVLRDLLTHLNTCDKLSGVIDFCPAAFEVQPGDVQLAQFLGVALTPPVQTSNADVTGFTRIMGVSKYTTKFQKRWSLNLRNPELEQVAEEAGWSWVRVVNNLKSLLVADGMVAVDPALHAHLSSQGVELADFTKLLTSAGQQFLPFPESVDADALAFAILGK